MKDTPHPTPPPHHTKNVHSLGKMHKSGSFSHTVELDKLSAEEITCCPCLSPPSYHLHLWEWYSSSSGPFWLGTVDVLPALVAVNCSASHNLPLY